VEDGDSPGWVDADACGDDIDWIGVYVEVDHAPLVAPASLASRHVQQHTVMRLEPITVSGGCTSS
jgi:hypothetical protein